MNLSSVVAQRAARGPKVGRDDVDVAKDTLNIVYFTTNYVGKLDLTTEGVILKVGDYRNQNARTVNITRNRNKTNNWLQDKLLAARLAYRLVSSLRRSANG